MNITLYAVNDDVFNYFKNLDKEYPFNKLHNKIKDNIFFKAENVKHIGHITCEKLLYECDVPAKVEPIKFLCGSTSIDIKDSEDGFCLMNNNEITKEYMDFINEFDFEKELNKYEAKNIIEEWEELGQNFTEEEIMTGNNFSENIKKAFNYANNKKLNLIWEYLY